MNQEIIPQPEPFKSIGIYNNELRRTSHLRKKGHENLTEYEQQQLLALKSGRDAERRREAAVLNENEREMAEQKACTPCGVVIYMVLFIVFTVQFEKKESQSEMDTIKHQSRTLYNVIMANLALFLIGMLYNLMSWCCLTSNNFKKLDCFGQMFSMTWTVVAIIGLSLTYSDKNKLWGLQQFQLYHSIQWMFWLTITPLLFVGLICSCLCLCMCFQMCHMMYVVCFRDGQQPPPFYQQHNHAARLSRLPLVNKFISSSARKYDPSKDCDIETCVICMEEFSTADGKKIAQLNCSSKHIFHVDCITEWVKKQDVCPMCREPIVAKEN